MVPKICSIEDCLVQVATRGWCEKHYQRWRKHGDPLKSLIEDRPKTCIVDSCDRPAAGRGMCKMHWKRWRTHGDPNIVAVRSKPKHIGCLVDGCETKHHSHGYCSTHATRLATHGDPLVVGDRFPGRPRLEHPKYAAIHKRLAREKGLARDQLCVDCNSPADEWSYDGGCPNELYETLAHTPIAYSADLARYQPRCLSCHRRKDGSLDRRRGLDGRFTS